MHLHATAGLLGLAILGIVPAALAADIPGNTKTKATITPGPARLSGLFERQADSDWYRVTLKAGRNYAFEVNTFCDTRMNLRNAAGKLLKSSDVAFDEDDAGFEFRSATTKTYYVEYVDANPAVCLEYEGPYPHGYTGNVAMEVRGDTTTRGTIAPGQTIASLLNWDTDQDYFRAQLYANRSYTLSVSGPDGHSPPQGTMLRVVDPKGKVIAEGSLSEPPTGFRVPATGTYYVVVWGDNFGFGPYVVGLRTP
jgi:hypothetical protein